MRLAKWNALTKAEQESFAPVCPDFVLELKSSSDRLTDLQEKMQSYLENGAQLGWLVVLEEQTVHIYQPDQPPSKHTDFNVPLAADPILPGFRLDFSKLRLPGTEQRIR